MKKILALLLAMMMVLSLAACGGNEETPSGSGTTDPGASQNNNDDKTRPNDVFDDITTENCLQLVEDAIGITIALPEGWSISEASSLLGAHILIACGGSVPTADAEAFFESVFAALKEATGADGVGHYDNVAYSTFAEGDAASESSFNFEKSDGTAVYVDFKIEDWDFSTGEEMVEAVGLYLKIK